MGFAQKIKAVHINKQYPRFSRQIVLPNIDTGIGAVLTGPAGTCTYGDWADIALLGLIAREKLIVGVVLDTPTAGIYTVDIGVTHVQSPTGGTTYATAAAVKTAVGLGTITNAQVHRAEVRVEVASDAAIFEMIPLTFPVYVGYHWGIIGRVKSLAGGAQTIAASVVLLEYFE